MPTAIAHRAGVHHIRCIRISEAAVLCLGGVASGAFRSAITTKIAEVLSEMN